MDFGDVDDNLGGDFIETNHKPLVNTYAKEG